MAALSGKNAAIYVSGVSTSFTDEACTTVSANTVYQITNTAKRVWDRSVTVTVKKDTVAQAATLYTLNRLTGTVTFLADIGGGHTITVSGNYLPISQAAQAKTYSYTIAAGNLNVTKFGDTYTTAILGLKNVSGSLSTWGIDTYFRDALIAGSPVVIEFWTDTTSGVYDLRVWALLTNEQVKEAVAGAVDVSVSFVGSTDVDTREISG